MSKIIGRNDWPLCVCFTEDGYVYCADKKHLSGYFFQSELEQLKSAIEKTLQMYEDESITDEYIISRDEEALKIEFERFNNLSRIPKKPREDDLYLIYDDTSQLLKIGRSVDAKKRLKQLQTANGRKLMLLCVLKKKGELEESMQRKFAKLNTCGEWYKYSEDIIKEYKLWGGTILIDKNKEKELKEKFVEFVKLYKKLTNKPTRGIDTEFNDFVKRHKDWQTIIPYLSIAIERETRERNEAKAMRRFFPEPKMLQTYLGKQRAWEMYVDVTKGIDETETEYKPTCGGALSWNDQYNCYLYAGMFFGHIGDGYSDENRPNGATVMLNNGRGTIVWNSATKTWDIE